MLFQLSENESLFTTFISLKKIIPKLTVKYSIGCGNKYTKVNMKENTALKQFVSFTNCALMRK